MWYQPKVDKLSEKWYCLHIFDIVYVCLPDLWWHHVYEHLTRWLGWGEKPCVGPYTYFTPKLLTLKVTSTDRYNIFPQTHFFSQVDNVIMFLTFSYIVFWENKHAYLRKYVADRSSLNRRQSVWWSHHDLSISENNSIGLFISQWGNKYQITKS